jgi:hypothetical protein
MNRFDHFLSYGTAGTGLGGALLAQATESPSITLGAIVLSVIGLLSLWVRAHYHLAESRLEAQELRKDLEVYKRLWVHDHPYPFAPDGRPRCAEEGWPTPAPSMPAAAVTSARRERS